MTCLFWKNRKWCLYEKENLEYAVGGVYAAFQLSACGFGAGGGKGGGESGEVNLLQDANEEEATISVFGRCYASEETDLGNAEYTEELQEVAVGSESEVTLQVDDYPKTLTDGETEKSYPRRGFLPQRSETIADLTDTITVPAVPEDPEKQDEWYSTWGDGVILVYQDLWQNVVDILNNADRPAVYMTEKYNEVSLNTENGVTSWLQESWLPSIDGLQAAVSEAGGNVSTDLQVIATCFRSAVPGTENTSMGMEGDVKYHIKVLLTEQITLEKTCVILPTRWCEMETNYDNGDGTNTNVEVKGSFDATPEVNVQRYDMTEEDYKQITKDYSIFTGESWALHKVEVETVPEYTDINKFDNAPACGQTVDGGNVVGYGGSIYFYDDEYYLSISPVVLSELTGTDLPIKSGSTVMLSLSNPSDWGKFDMNSQTFRKMGTNEKLNVNIDLNPEIINISDHSVMCEVLSISNESSKVMYFYYDNTFVGMSINDAYYLTDAIFEDTDCYMSELPTCLLERTDVGLLSGSYGVIYADGFDVSISNVAVSGPIQVSIKTPNPIMGDDNMFTAYHKNSNTGAYETGNVSKSSDNTVQATYTTTSASPFMVCAVSKNDFSIPVQNLNASDQIHSPQTGEHGSADVWFAVLLLSGGAVLTLQMVRRRDQS